MDSQTIKIAAADLWNNARIAIHNLQYRLKPPEVDFIVFALSGNLPEYVPPPPSWHKWLPFPLPGGWSLNSLRYAFEQIARDPRPVGVILHLGGLDIGWATAQSLRNLMQTLRAANKQVVVYSPYHDIIRYYVATAANTILAPRPAMWEVPGLRVELTFLKDAFAMWGISAEVVNVSPYKTAGDTLARSDISPEHQAMIEWIMNGRFETVVSAIAQARQLEPEQVRELINRAPLPAEAARAAGLLDAVVYEDELPTYLGPHRRPGKQPWLKFKWSWAKKDKEPEDPAHPKAALKRWSAVSGSLRRLARWRTGKYIAIIPLEGTIIIGRTTTPIPPLPLPIPIPFTEEELAGSETIAQHFRDAEKDPEVAAIVFYVNSRGGSAIASDLIWREMDRVRRKKPVVVYMGDYAASGGYFVSATANHIIAQPLTLTGSIGVVMMKLVTAGLYEKFQANRVVIKRGANVGLYADDAPFTPELRAVAEAQTAAYYADFKNVVMQGRKLAEPALEEVAGGRVWLGQQALEHKLVDQLGGLTDAIEKAKELAKLPKNKHTDHFWYSSSGGNLLPPPFPAAANLADYFALLRTVLRERVWLISPFQIK